MNDRTITEQSKKLSWLLRHGAGREGLTMDAAGWVPVDDVLRRLRLSRGALAQIVERNTKSRLQWEGERIRCCQGHSSEGMPVTQDALERSWRVWTGGPVWHGTKAEVIPAIAREGLRPGGRTHVHLAPSTDSVVGKRAAVAVMLEIDPAPVRAAGHELFESPNGVVLARLIPAAAIVGLHAMTRRARAQEAELIACFGGRLSAAG